MEAKWSRSGGCQASQSVWSHRFIKDALDILRRQLDLWLLDLFKPGFCAAASVKWVVLGLISDLRLYHLVFFAVFYVAQEQKEAGSLQEGSCTYLVCLRRWHTGIQKKIGERKNGASLVVCVSVARRDSVKNENEEWKICACISNSVHTCCTEKEQERNLCVFLHIHVFCSHDR